MAIELAPKQPREVIPGVYIDFKKRLLSEEFIDTAIVTPSVPSVIVSNILYSGTVVSWTVSGGNSGDICVFTAIVTGSKGSVREAEVQISIEDTN